MLAATYSYLARVVSDLQSRSESSHRNSHRLWAHISPHLRSQDKYSSIALDYLTSCFISVQRRAGLEIRGELPLKGSVDQIHFTRIVQRKTDWCKQNWTTNSMFPVSFSMYLIMPGVFCDVNAAILVFANSRTVEKNDLLMSSMKCQGTAASSFA